MHQIFFILLIIAMCATLVSLVLGLTVMAKGGELNQKYGNKMMRLRVVLQGIALVLFALTIMTKA